MGRRKPKFGTRKDTVVMIPREKDMEVLEMLDLYHGDGLSAKQVGEVMGVSRNTVIGQVNRIGKEDDAPCKCTLKRNKNLGMKRGWWR